MLLHVLVFVFARMHVWYIALAHAGVLKHNLACNAQMCAFAHWAPIQCCSLPSLAADKPQPKKVRYLFLIYSLMIY